MSWRQVACVSKIPFVWHLRAGHFQVSIRLTLELGLRWDRFGKPNYDDGLIHNWDPRVGQLIVPSAAVKAISSLYPQT